MRKSPARLVQLLAVKESATWRVLSIPHITVHLAVLTRYKTWTKTLVLWIDSPTTPWLRNLIGPMLPNKRLLGSKKLNVWKLIAPSLANFCLFACLVVLLIPCSPSLFSWNFAESNSGGRVSHPGMRWFGSRDGALENSLHVSFVSSFRWLEQNSRHHATLYSIQLHWITIMHSRGVYLCQNWLAGLVSSRSLWVEACNSAMFPSRRFHRPIYF